MKVIIAPLFLAAFLCGCNSGEDAKISALQVKLDQLQTKISAFTNQPTVTNQISQAQIAELKLWTLDHLEELQIEEATNRYVLETNLEALIFETARISVMSKQP